MLFHPRLAFSVSLAKENHICPVEVGLFGKRQVSFSQKVIMDHGHLLSGMTGTLDKHDLCHGMVQQNPDQLSGGISSCPDYSYLYLVHSIIISDPLCYPILAARVRFSLLVDGMVNLQGITQNGRESFHLLACPCLAFLSILTKHRTHQVII